MHQFALEESIEVSVELLLLVDLLLEHFEEQATKLLDVLLHPGLFLGPTVRLRQLFGRDRFAVVCKTVEHVLECCGKLSRCCPTNLKHHMP